MAVHTESHVRSTKVDIELGRDLEFNHYPLLTLTPLRLYNRAELLTLLELRKADLFDQSHCWVCVGMIYH